MVMMARLFLLGLLLFAGKALSDSCKAEHSCKMEELGCYNDNYQRAMPEQLLNERDATSKVYGGQLIDWKHYETYILDFACRCAKIAASKGYTVIGLQFYGECWSGPNAHEVYDKYGESSECVSGKFHAYNKEDTCMRYMGRSWTNMVYRIAVPGCAKHNIEPVGCFHDDLKLPRPVPNYISTERDYSIPQWNGHLIDWQHWLTYSPQMVCRCIEAAKKRGDDYFAIQFWGECWSGKSSEVKFNRNGGSLNCVDEHFKPCKCNSYICVGKAYTNYVYKINYDKCSAQDEPKGIDSIEIW